MKEQLITELQEEFVKFLTLEHYHCLVVINKQDEHEVYEYIKSQLPDEHFGAEYGKYTPEIKLNTSRITVRSIVKSDSERKWHHDYAGSQFNTVLIDGDANYDLSSNTYDYIVPYFDESMRYLIGRLRCHNGFPRMVIL